MVETQEYLIERNKLNSDKNISRMQIQNYQSNLANLLKNGMGEDIKKVTSHEVLITGIKKEPFYKKILRYLDEFLSRI